VSTTATEINSVHSQLIKFAIGDQYYAVDVAFVTNIIEWRDLTPLANVPAHLLGLTNVRGRTMPVVDLRVLFNLSTLVLPEEARIIVATSEHGPLGLVVDSVSQVLNEGDAEPSPSQKVVCGLVGKYIKEFILVEKDLVAVLDIQAIISGEVAA
jgi:purine-binding chemotaxis protein CheW